MRKKDTDKTLMRLFRMVRLWRGDRKISPEEYQEFLDLWCQLYEETD